MADLVHPFDADKLISILFYFLLYFKLQDCLKYQLEFVYKVHIKLTN